MFGSVFALESITLSPAQQMFVLISVFLAGLFYLGVGYIIGCLSQERSHRRMMIRSKREQQLQEITHILWVQVEENPGHWHEYNKGSEQQVKAMFGEIILQRTGSIVKMAITERNRRPDQEGVRIFELRPVEASSVRLAEPDPKMIRQMFEQ